MSNEEENTDRKTDHFDVEQAEVDLARAQRKEADVRILTCDALLKRFGTSASGAFGWFTALDEYAPRVGVVPTKNGLRDATYEPRIAAEWDDADRRRAEATLAG